ncbi:MAG: aminotransferase class V-fold PLP-dependent enzyme [Oscillospiraceae bacterium]|nr:aminotransferase class V-fold PLP-dependent enzyme [Oscillospiraceae bacterium]MCL2278365.1 aminotransferase class V-fold PLP-dependent enzyme [Oscillospiraceae bacterium]
MKKVYADNSATSFPKAPGVSDAIKDFLDNVGCNVNRGGYESSYNAALEILATRKQLCKLFNFDEPRNVIFTPGITHSLNMILKGFLKVGDHVITTSMEHNSVMRPLHELSKTGVSYDIAECRSDGSLSVEKVTKLINKNTKAVVMTHASNVCGTILPIYDISELCKKHEVKLIVDSAGTAGVLELDMSCADALAFTCHKGLLAMQGLGGFLIKSDLAERTLPIITGGTGSLSHDIIQPDFLPDKFESGTMNIPAIMGLKVALEYICNVGVRAIHEKEMKHAEKFLSEMSKLSSDVRIVGQNGLSGRIAVISLDFKSMDNAEVASILDRDYGIMTRCGLHCAPMAHKTLKTYPQGTIRFSFGQFNTSEDVEYAVMAVREIVERECN